jgi:DNA-binding NarL/FixJ family response regulator
MSTRILIADDHPAIRAGLLAVLTGTEFEVAAQAADCDQALRYTLACDPEVVLLDLGMPGGDAIDVIKAIKEKRPQTRVLVFTAAESVAAMIQTHRVGADGYLSKGISREDLLDAMRRVLQGKQAWSRRQLRQIGTGKRCHYSSNTFASLTERECQVLSAIVDGLSNDGIADRLNIDLETVKQHVKRLLAKIGVEDRTQAALWALRTLDEPPAVEQ